MPKNIVLCSDGTGNAAVKNRGTNVFKLFEAVDLQRPPKNSELSLQVAYYDDGVGTQSFKPLKILGGAFGWGLERNVRQLYTELARVYEPGDRIYMFGFSRGAFTVRTLAGIIGQVGIVDRASAGSNAELERFVKLAFQAHRKCYQRWISKKLGREIDTTTADRFRDRYAVKHDVHAPQGKVEIEFIGVWDTVDAVGFPVDEVAQAWNAVVYPFKAPDMKLSAQVRHAAHAIAIDDERYTFHPVLWDERDEANGRIEQVWFAGVHSNVGGGYSKQGMSLTALVWMMDQAEKNKLRFLPSVRQLLRELENVNDKLYDSRAGLASYYRYKPRDLGAMCQSMGMKPKIHLSVIERIALGTEAYSPGNFPLDFEVVSESQPTVAATVTRILTRRPAALLEQTSNLISLRRACHSVVVAWTIYMLAGVAWYAMQPTTLAALGTWNGFSTAAGRLSKLSSWGGVWDSLQPLLVDRWWAVLVCFIALGGSWLSRSTMNSIYAEYWYKLRPTLRKVFEAEARVEAAGS